jgi:hypothetical protein
MLGERRTTPYTTTGQTSERLRIFQLFLCSLLFLPIIVDLEAGAEVDAKDKICYTALDVAKNDDVKKALLEHGAKLFVGSLPLSRGNAGERRA